MSGSLKNAAERRLQNLETKPVPKVGHKFDFDSPDIFQQVVSEIVYRTELETFWQMYPKYLAILPPVNRDEMREAFLDMSHVQAFIATLKHKEGEFASSWPVTRHLDTILPSIRKAMTKAKTEIRRHFKELSALLDTGMIPHDKPWVKK